MTEPATIYRPSPHPRPATQPRPEQPRLHVVPDAATLQPETATAAGTPLQDVPAGQDHAGHATSPADGLQIAERRGFFARSRAYWTPPAIFTEAPPALADLADYARHAPWTHQSSGIARTFGVGWYRYVAYPYTVWSRYKEHAAQRPGRLAVHLGLLKLLTLTGPGIWLVDHLIYPAARLAGHLFL